MQDGILSVRSFGDYGASKTAFICCKAEEVPERVKQLLDENSRLREERLSDISWVSMKMDAACLPIISFYADKTVAADICWIGLTDFGAINTCFLEKVRHRENPSSLVYGIRWQIQPLEHPEHELTTIEISDLDRWVVLYFGAV